jgi:hypothetical protein
LNNSSTVDAERIAVGKIINPMLRNTPTAPRIFQNSAFADFALNSVERFMGKVKVRYPSSLKKCL